MADAPNARDLTTLLRNSADDLNAVLHRIGPESLTAPSYCSDWTIAQVLSHLGSGAEIFTLLIEAGLNGSEPPGREIFPSIWDSWNAKTPEEQAADYKSANAALLEQFESLDDAQIADFRMQMMGRDLDIATVIGMRLSEHALHSWDIKVMSEPDARLDQGVVSALATTYVGRVAPGAKPVGERVEVLIETSEPDARFLLTVDESATLEEDPEIGDKPVARLFLPAEALIRLATGRLDEAHTPSEVKAEGIDLDTLRQIFPGF
jgi:uncharacterized protein (TIGR03083 family)